MRLVLILAASALAIGACNQAPEAGNSTQANNQAAPAKPEVVSHPEPALVGKFTAISSSAMAITGDLDLSADAARFAMDQSYQTRTPTRVAASTRFSSGASDWAGLLGVQRDATVEIRHVTEQKVGKAAPNGSLCGTEPVSYIAFANVPAGDDAGLRVAAFQGKQAPGPQAAEADLCGTFLYAPAGR